jgi:hypothetical protein
MKIFLIGWHKTGTKSIASCLRTLGFQTKHFPIELYNGKNIDFAHEMFDEYDAFCDLPIPLIYRELDQIYPNARFIFSIREEFNWASSCRTMFKYHLKYNKWDEDIHKLHESIYGTKVFDRKTMMARYRAHNQEVQSYFGDSDKLLTIHTEHFQWEPFCEFLAKPIPETPFPHIGKRDVLYLNKEISQM